jgi:small GTP-binding protein
MAASLDAKIVLLGAASVGKTCIICRAVSNEFDSEMPNTIGACFTAKEMDVAGSVVNLQIWDTAGQERFRTLAPMYYRGSVIAVLVYAVTDQASLDDVKNWADEMKIQTDEMPVLFVVGNKMDLVDERVVQYDHGESMAKELGAFFTEVSAKTGVGVDELFIRIAEEALKRLKGEGADVPPAAMKVELKDEVGPKKKKKKSIC